MKIRRRMKQIVPLLILVFPAWYVSAGHLFGDVHVHGHRNLDSRNERLLQNYGQYLLKEDHETFVRPDWTDATRRAKAFLDGWSIEDLVTLTSGVGWARGGLEAIPVYVV